MSDSPGPVVTRRRLRIELRRLRLGQALSIDDVATHAEWSTSKLARIENGQVGISKQDLTDLLAYYGVTDPDYTRELHQLARASRQRMWWSRYQKHLSASFLEFLGAEFDASVVCYYQPLIVPGLLQTKAYAQAINAATAFGEIPPDAMSARLEVRLRRQDELLRRRSGVRIIAILDEAVLHRPVGSSEVMREQFDRVIELAKQRIVELVVLPFSAGPHLGLLGAFTLLEYQEARDDDVVYLENPSGGLVLRDQAEVVEVYHRTIEKMINSGVGNNEAIGFVGTTKKQLFG
ncbi:MAG: helix-turn-helix domain-containing protein [Micromonosporaceae bacterium]|nr:helix-turn-helix domain-containing protein [Micromonosporaceae bacterium]